MPATPKQKLKKWEYPKKSGIWIREMIYSQNYRGEERLYSSYQVTIPAKVTGTVRKRKQFTDLGEANKFASDQSKGADKEGEAYFLATDAERREFGATLPKLREHGVTLTEAVEFALKRLRPKGGERTIGDIARELVESKRARYERGDLRERSFRDFDHRASKFADSFAEVPSYELTVEDLKDWLMRLEVTPRTTQNYLSIVSEILKYAVQKKYIAFSPVDELTDADRKELCGSGAGESEPTILTVDQAERLLLAAREHTELGMMGAVTIGLFCGVRVEEMKRLDWANVHDSDSHPVVTITPEVAKKRRIRHVDIPRNALKWLSLCADRSGVVAKNEHYNDYQKRFRKLLKLAGFGSTDDKGHWRSDWGANAMRHSFGSYHFALHGNSLETARQLGHKASDQVLFNHYRALVSKDQGREFFSIDPDA